MHVVLHLLRLARALAADRTRLALENLALRQQLAVFQRNVERPKVNDSGRLFWTVACEFVENWREHLVIVKPDSVIRWQSLTEAFPGDEAVPRYLHRDRDSIYGAVVRQRIASLGMKDVISAKQSPWQNPFAERVIGSIRRECTDHLVPLNEAHLRKTLQEYVEYYNGSRRHQSLEGNSPEPRVIESGDGSVIAIPHVGGLHHEYRRAG